MSIANEITRLNNAKTNIAAAIKGKGVTVPAGTKLDGMASIIGQIQQGSNLEASTLSAGSAVGGTTYYIDTEGQGQAVEFTLPDGVECLRGSYFVVDYAYAADGFYLAGCELVRAYGPVLTTINDGEQNYVLILKVTGSSVITMI